jgi:hypothetical protein
MKLLNFYILLQNRVFLVIGLTVMFFSCSKKNNNEINTEKDAVNFQTNNPTDKILTDIKSSDLNTWSTTSTNRFFFDNIIATKDNGFAFMEQSSEYGVKFYKYNSDGEVEFAKSISDNKDSKCFFTVTNDNKFILTVDNNIMLLKEDGVVEKEFNFNDSAILSNISRLHCFDNEIIIISDYTIIKLDLDFNLVKEIYFSDIYSRLTPSRNGRLLAINAITKDLKGNYFFTGCDNDLLWYGKLDRDFKMIWEKSDLNLEQSREKAENGVEIIYFDDNSIVILSKHPNVNDRGASCLMSVNSAGKENWKMVVKGNCDKKNYSFMTKISNLFYVITMDKRYYDRTDTRTYDSNNYEYAVLSKYELSSNCISSSEINVDNKNITFKGITSNTDSTFFVCGQIQSLSVTNIKYLSHSSVTKFNSDGNTKNRIIEY